MGNHFHLLLETPQANLVPGRSGCSERLAYLNSGIFYDCETGNIRGNIHPSVSFVGEIANVINVLVAAPFVASSLLPTRNTFQ
jgi:hypothetical protein